MTKTYSTAAQDEDSARYRQARLCRSGAQSGSGVARADCERAHFFKRPAAYHRDFLYRKISGADTILRQDFNFAKIKSAEEKSRLRQLIEFIKPRNFGVIVRTSAEGKKVPSSTASLKLCCSRLKTPARKLSDLQLRRSYSKKKTAW